MSKFLRMTMDTERILCTERFDLSRRVSSNSSHRAATEMARSLGTLVNKETTSKETITSSSPIRWLDTSFRSHNL